MALKQSKFNIAFEVDDSYVYFNKIANLLGEFTPAEHEAFLTKRYLEPGYSEARRRWREIGCLVPAERNETRLLGDYYSRFVKPFEFTIELSRACNFKCTYCYQTGTHDYRNVISQEVMDACVRYATFVLSDREINEFEMNFIGGEPLLHQEQLLYIYSRVVEVLDKKPGVRWKAALDTHGALLNSAFLSACRNCVFSVSLTPPEHHNRTRPLIGGQPTFGLIVNNLVKNKEHFDRDGNLLIIRYNLDHENRDAMPDFMHFIKGLGIRNLSFMVVNVVNYDFNLNYRNELTEADYFQQCGIALEEMVNLEIPVRVIPYGVITPCYVFTPYSCKVFYDGRLNGCDIADKPGEGSIFSLPDEDSFRRRESMNALTHKLCMGEYKICNLQVFPLVEYLRAFRRATAEGKGYLFDNFRSYSQQMRNNVEKLIAAGQNGGGEAWSEPVAARRSQLPILSL